MEFFWTQHIFSGNQCPSDSTSCMAVPEYNQNDCRSSYACELPNGTVVYGLSADECRYQCEIIMLITSLISFAHDFVTFRNTAMSCTGDCLHNSCQSATHMSGVCYLPATSSQTQCQLMGAKYNTSVEWYGESLCVVTSAQTPTDCAKVAILFLHILFTLNENVSITEYKSNWKLELLQYF